MNPTIAAPPPPIGLVTGHRPAEIPASHLDLAECPPVAALTTLSAAGDPQTSVVWSDLEGELIRVNTMRGFAKERNMRRDPRVTLLGYDARQPLRALEVRGTVVEMTEAGAAEHLDAIASKYAGRPIRYFGDAIPAAFAETEVPVLCRIRPAHVVAIDATAPRRAAVAIDEAAVAIDEAAVAIDGVEVPASHTDLLIRPICGVLTTLMPGGQPQSSLVWVDFDGRSARVNTTLERQKGRNLVADPRVSLLVVDPNDTGRYLQIRGEAVLSTAGAVEHLDELTRAYTRHRHYYGGIYPVAQRGRETRVIGRIRARRVTVDAIHR